MPETADQPAKPRARHRRWVLALADLALLVHVLGWSCLLFYLGIYWMRKGQPALPLAEVPMTLWAVMAAYFVATLALLVSWLVSLQRSEHLNETKKWAWAIGICLVPLVGVVYHVRHFRTSLTLPQPPC